MHSVAKLIGQRIRAAREAAGISQRELGEMVGFSQVSIHRIEAGKAQHSVYNIARIARALGVQAGDLLGDHLWHAMREAYRQAARRSIVPGERV